MKIIHCADIHADSKFGTHFSKEQADERRKEIVDTFANMVHFARENGVKAIIIAGDLFDTKASQQKNIKKRFSYIISQNPDIDFLYLRGNHDEDSDFFTEDKLPNLKLFSKDEWKTYSYDNDKIQIIYFDNSQFDGTEASAKKCLKYMFYYAVVESDAKEHKEFSDEEILITRPFEDSLKMGKFKSISHKNQNVSAKDVETFEFEFNSDKWDEHGINSYIYPEETDSIHENVCRIDNKIIYYFSIDADIKYLITFDIVIWGHNLGTIVYIVSASDYFKNTPIIRKNIIETIDRKKIENLVKASKKREDMEYKEFLSYFRELTKNLTNSEKAYALYYWIAKNISYDFEGYSSGDSDINPESVYKNGYVFVLGILVYSVLLVTI